MWKKIKKAASLLEQKIVWNLEWYLDRRVRIMIDEGAEYAAVIDYVNRTIGENPSWQRIYAVFKEEA